MKMKKLLFFLFFLFLSSQALGAITAVHPNGGEEFLPTDQSVDFNVQLDNSTGLLQIFLCNDASCAIKYLLGDLNVADASNHSTFDMNASNFLHYDGNLTAPYLTPNLADANLLYSFSFNHFGGDDNSFVNLKDGAQFPFTSRESGVFGSGAPRLTDDNMFIFTSAGGDPDEGFLLNDDAYESGFGVCFDYYQPVDDPANYRLVGVFDGTNGTWVVDQLNDLVRVLIWTGSNSLTTNFSSTTNMDTGFYNICAGFSDATNRADVWINTINENNATENNSLSQNSAKTSVAIDDVIVRNGDGTKGIGNLIIWNRGITDVDVNAQYDGNYYDINSSVNQKWVPFFDFNSAFGGSVTDAGDANFTIGLLPDPIFSDWNIVIATTALLFDINVESDNNFFWNFTLNANGLGAIDQSSIVTYYQTKKEGDDTNSVGYLRDTELLGWQVEDNSDLPYSLVGGAGDINHYRSDDEETHAYKQRATNWPADELEPGDQNAGILLENPGDWLYVLHDNVPVDKNVFLDLHLDVNYTGAVNRNLSVWDCNVAVTDPDTNVNCNEFTFSNGDNTVIHQISDDQNRLVGDQNVAMTSEHHIYFNCPNCNNTQFWAFLAVDSNSNIDKVRTQYSDDLGVGSLSAYAITPFTKQYWYELDSNNYFQYIIQADVAGTDYNSAMQQELIDFVNLPPIISNIESPVAGSTVAGTIDINIHVSDPNADTLVCDANLIGDNNGAVTTQLMSSLATSTHDGIVECTTTFDTTTVADQNYYISFRVRETGTSELFSFDLNMDTDFIVFNTTLHDINFNIFDDYFSTHLNSCTFDFNVDSEDATGDSPLILDFFRGHYSCNLTCTDYNSIDFNFIVDANKTITKFLKGDSTTPLIEYPYLRYYSAEDPRQFLSDKNVYFEAMDSRPYLADRNGYLSSDRADWQRIGKEDLGYQFVTVVTPILVIGMFIFIIYILLRRRFL